MARKWQHEKAYQLFSVLGMDSGDVARVMHVTEQTALRWITQGRCEKRSLSDPYQQTLPEGEAA